MHNSAADAITPCCNVKWRVLVDLSRRVAFKPFAATNAPHSSYRQMIKQTGSSEPLGGATTAQDAIKEPSPTPAALAGRRKGGKNWNNDE
jgi:phosphoglycolate phosphatase-like HAD superfamily hydrolase